MARITEHSQHTETDLKQAWLFMCADIMPVMVRLYVNMVIGLIDKEAAP